MIDILSLPFETVEKQIADLGYPRYRAKQLFQWLAEGCRNFEEMTNLPKALRQLLGDRYLLHNPRLLRKQTSGGGRYNKVPLGAPGRSFGGNGIHALSLREFRLYLQPGRMPSGLCFLCLYDRWPGSFAESR